MRPIGYGSDFRLFDIMHRFTNVRTSLDLPAPCDRLELGARTGLAQCRRGDHRSR